MIELVLGSLCSCPFRSKPTNLFLFLVCFLFFLPLAGSCVSLWLDTASHESQWQAGYLLSTPERTCIVRTWGWSWRPWFHPEKMFSRMVWSDLQPWEEGQERIHPGSSREQGFVDVNVEQQWGLTNVLHYRCIVLQRQCERGTSEMGKNIIGRPENITGLLTCVQWILSKSNAKLLWRLLLEKQPWLHLRKHRVTSVQDECAHNIEPLEKQVISQEDVGL